MLNLSSVPLAAALAQLATASYHCFDRVLLFGHLMGLTRAGGVHNIYRNDLGIEQITPEVLVARTERYRKWVYSFAKNRCIPILPSSPEVRNEDLVECFYRRFRGKQGIVCILRTMENCLTYVSRKPRFATKDPKHHFLRSCRRRVQCFYFYILDPEFGRCWVKVQTHLPFGVAVCFNGHQWLAQRMQRLALRVDRRDNCFINSEDWGKLQQEADQLDANAMRRLCDRWVYRLAPFFSSNQRQAGGLYYQYFFSQVEYCHNLIFKRSVALINLFDRIIDRSRNVGRPDLLTTFFGTKVYRSQGGKLQTKIIDRDKAHPVIKTWYKKGWIKQYEKEGRLLRTECTVNNTYDVGVQRSLRNLVALRQKMADINQRYLQWLDPISLSLVEDGALASLSETTVVGMRRIPGIKIENRRLMAVVQSLPHFCNVTAGFTTQSLREQAVATHRVEKEYTLSQVRYDLGKLRAKGLIERVPGQHRYRLTCVGLNTCALLTKLRSSFFGPLLSLARRSRPDTMFDTTSTINHCYRSIDGALKTLMAEVGICYA
jgi:hypothetical protein